MTIKVGDRLPEGELQEFVEVETAGCSLGPEHLQGRGPRQGQEDRDLRTAGRVHADLLGEACSKLHRKFDALKAKGVDEIWCMSVNDPFVMGAWGRDQKATGKVRMMADGSAAYTQASSDSSSISPRAGWESAASGFRCWSTTVS